MIVRSRARPATAPGPEGLEAAAAGRVVSYVHRPGRGETLLYFHGLGGCKEDFLGAWSVAAWLDHELVAFDAPQCGETRDDPGSESRDAAGAREPDVDDIVATAEALVSRLGLADVTVIGHSMGGLAGLLFAMRNPELVRRFVSVEGNLVPGDCSIYSRDARAVRGLETQRTYVEKLAARMRASGRPGYAEAARELGGNVRTGAFFSYCRSIVRFSDEEPLLDHFAALGVPRLFVHGDWNADLPQLARLVREGVPIAEVAGSDHFPMHSNPDGYYRVLVRFIEETI